MSMGGSGVGAGPGFTGVQPRFDMADGQLSVTGADGQATMVGLIDGQLDLGSLVDALVAEGYSEAEILTNLEGIVANIEAEVELEVVGKEAYKEYLSDSFVKVETKRSDRAGNVSDGITDELDMLMELCEEEGIYVNPSEVQDFIANNGEDPEFQAAVEKMSQFINNTEDPLLAKDSLEFLAGYVAQYPDGDLMMVVVAVMTSSVEQNNLNKQYFMKGLKEMNDIAEALAEQLNLLRQYSDMIHEEISNQRSTMDDDTKKTFDPNHDVSISMATAAAGMDPSMTEQQLAEKLGDIDLDALGADGNVNHTSAATYGSLTAETIQTKIGDVETNMETVRNKRQEYVTAFEAQDQKSNQDMNVIKSILQASKGGAEAITRNLL